MEKITAGRDALGEFAPQFAHFNDDILFGEVWSREERLSPRDRSLITVAALMGSGILDRLLFPFGEHEKDRRTDPGNAWRRFVGNRNDCTVYGGL